MSRTRYRSNKTIDAVQWVGSNTGEVKEFLGDKGRVYDVSPTGMGMHVATDWGTIRVKKGDFITVDDEGHVSHNSAETFATYYERIEEVA